MSLRQIFSDEGRPQLSLLRLALVSFVALSLSSVSLLPGRAWAEPEATGQPEQSNRQEWNGTLDAGVAKLRLTIEISRDKQQNLSAVLISRDQGNMRVPCNAITLTKDALSIELKKIDGQFTGKLNATGDEAQGTWTQAGTDFPLTLKKGPAIPIEPIAIWRGTLAVPGMQLKLQLREMPPGEKEDDDETGKPATSEYYFDSLTQGATNLTATWERDGQQVTVKVPVIKGTFDGEMNAAENALVGTWRQGLIEIPLTLQRVAASESAVLFKRPQTPKPPFPYRVENIVIQHPQIDAVRLAGTITLPEHPGQYPAVVLVSGSGPQDRDETIMGHKPFLVIADYLTRRGVVVLRYDDRGTGESTGDFKTATTRDFATDTAAAVAQLRKHEEVDPNRIGLIGHSEGGLIAPFVEAELEGHLAHMILLAGPAIDGTEILLTQSTAIVKSLGRSEAEIERHQTMMHAIIDGVRNNRPRDEMNDLVNELLHQHEATDDPNGKSQASQSASNPTKKTDRDQSNASDEQNALLEGLDQLDSPWFKYFLDYDPVPTLERVSCPVLALFGEYDLQVVPEANLPAMKRALEKSGNAESRCVTLPKTNHLFQTCENGSPALYGVNSETFSPQALEIMADWINNLPIDNTDRQ